MPTKTIPPVRPLFRSDDPLGSNTVTLRFNDQAITAPAGISVAAALLINGMGPFRDTPVTAAPRAPYCMMGVCFDCLVEVDGVPSRQACLTQVRESMDVRRQQGASALALPKEGEDHGR